MKAYMVDKSALAHNVRVILERAGGATVWGVIKGDGYGLGCVELARVLSAYGIDHFAVTEVSEVRRLREAGFEENAILMMEATADETELNELMDLGAILTISSLEQGQTLDRVARQRSAVAQAHVKIDTGMGRFGFLPEQIEQVYRLYTDCPGLALTGIYTHLRSAVAQAHVKIDTGMGRFGFLPEQIEQVYRLYTDCPGLALTGIYTHFACAVDPADTQKQYDAFQQVVQELHAAGFETGMVHCCNSTAFWKYEHMHCAVDPADTQKQYDAFQQVVQELHAAGFETGMVHCCNSTAFWKYEHMHCDAVRVGSALLGRVGFAGKAGLKSVGCCNAQIEEIRTIPAGHSVGYGAGWVAKRETRIARVGFAGKAGLKSVGCCNAQIEEIRTIPAGHSVGYGAGWVAKRETRIAVLPVGYFHGFGVDRGFDLWRFKDCVRGVARYIKAFLRHKALYVHVGGKACRVLGHVGMVNMVIDVTDCDCRVGDTARVSINPLLVKGMDVVYF